MEIDVRGEVSKVDKIRFDETSEEFFNACCIEKSYRDIFIIHDCLRERRKLNLSSKESAENLIKALQKAIELNWWK